MDVPSEYPAMSQSKIMLLESDRKMDSEVQQVKAFYRSLINSTPDAIYLSGLDHRILLVNRSGYEMLGYENEGELLGKNSLDLLIPQERLRAREMTQKMLEKQQGANFEYRMLCKDGRQIEVESNISLMLAEDGSPEYYLAVARDISARNTVELELRHSMAELARSNAFIAALSQVATRIETTSNPDQIFETIGAELKQLGITCLVSLKNRDLQLEMYYTSFQAGLLDQIEQQTGIRVKGFAFPIHPEIATNEITPNQAFFYPDVLEILYQLIPDIDHENA